LIIDSLLKLRTACQYVPQAIGFRFLCEPWSACIRERQERTAQ